MTVCPVGGRHLSPLFTCSSGTSLPTINTGCWPVPPKHKHMLVYVRRFYDIKANPLQYCETNVRIYRQK